MTHQAYFKPKLTQEHGPPYRSGLYKQYHSHPPAAAFREYGTHENPHRIEPLNRYPMTQGELSRTAMVPNPPEARTAHYKTTFGGFTTRENNFQQMETNRQLRSTEQNQPAFGVTERAITAPDGKRMPWAEAYPKSGYKHFKYGFLSAGFDDEPPPPPIGLPEDGDHRDPEKVYMACGLGYGARHRNHYNYRSKDMAPRQPLDERGVFQITEVQRKVNTKHTMY